MATNTVDEIWELSLEFGENGRGPRGFHGARDITTRYPHEIAVADYYNSQVVIYSIEGDYFDTIPINGLSSFGSTNPSGIATTKTGHRLVVAPGGDAKVDVFDEDDTLAFNFLTAPNEENTCPQPASIAVQQNGAILVGDILKKRVTEHDPCDGFLLRTIPVRFEPHYLDVDSQGRLIISPWKQEVQVTDNNGNTEFCIRPVMDGQFARFTKGVYVDSRDNIYIAMHGLDEGTGHIHRYDAQGSFRSCIAQDLFRPMGVTMTPNGQLAVADTNSIKLYNRVTETASRCRANVNRCRQEVDPPSANVHDWS